MVERKTTARYRARLAVVKAAGSSVASTVKLFAAPRSRRAVTPSSMEEWRKPAVREKTRIRYAGSAAGAAARGAAGAVPGVAAA